MATKAERSNLTPASTTAVDPILAPAMELQRKQLAAAEKRAERRDFLAALRERWASDPPGVDDARIEQQERRRALRAALEQLRAAAGRQYRRCKASNFQTHPFPPSALGAAKATDRRRRVHAEVVAFGRDLKPHIERGRGLVLYGPPGTGKDHLLFALARRAIALRATVRWVNGRDLFGEFRDAMDRRDLTEEGLIWKYAGCHVLVISDPLPATEHGLTRHEADMLYRILEDRTSRGRATWVSVNVSGEDKAREWLGGPVWDRLRRDALLLFCNWPSHREAWRIVQ